MMYSLDEITYSFIASYMWGVGGVSQIMTQYDLRGGGNPEEAKKYGIKNKQPLITYSGRVCRYASVFHYHLRLF